MEIRVLYPAASGFKHDSFSCIYPDVSYVFVGVVCPGKESPIYFLNALDAHVWILIGTRTQRSGSRLPGILYVKNGIFLSENALLYINCVSGPQKVTDDGKNFVLFPSQIVGPLDFVISQERWRECLCRNEFDKWDMRI